MDLGGWNLADELEHKVGRERGVSQIKTNNGPSAVLSSSAILQELTLSDP